MSRERGYRGWAAAATVAIILSLIFLAVEKHIHLPTADFWRAAHHVSARAASTEHEGIVLSVDPGLVGTSKFPPADVIPLERRPVDSSNSVTTAMLRRPPEPAANAVLKAPVAAEDFAALPLHDGTSSVELLMEAMDRALESPMRAVSAVKTQVSVESAMDEDGRFDALRSPAAIAGRMPEPTQLLNELLELSSMVDSSKAHQLSSTPIALNTVGFQRLTILEANAVNQWTQQVQSLVNQLTMEYGLENPHSIPILQQLNALSAHSTELGNRLTNHHLAATIIRTGYSLQRRVELWQAVQACLDGTSISLLRPRSPELARDDLAKAVAAAQEIVNQSGDPTGWTQFLMLNQLNQWLNSEDNVWQIGNGLALNVLSRMQWQRLSEDQRTFLTQPAFVELSHKLTLWGRDPIDYRQLLSSVEQFEQNRGSRVVYAIADTVQVLRSADQENQNHVAEVLNNHYRNANLRLTVSNDLLQRFLPNGDYEVRPVRQRILGADTAGDSAVHTELSVRFLPDPTGWNLDLGVDGDMVSMTQSSKGPAVFHNTSTAQLSSHRFLRLDPNGYRISSEPTNVDSQDYLRKMSTDFDGLPVIGDFVRLIVREQFDQKRGLAQRITRRIIANEADAELDRRLEEGLAQAERDLQRRIVGPLERLNLNPMVVSMNTTEERLTIRYRLANESQLAAHTPRPRAPSDCLLSMQLHESTINNTIEKIGLSGKTWKLPELYQRLGEVFQQSNWTLPEDVPQDITIRFADHRPVSVELADGKLRLTLRIAELHQQDRLQIQGFTITSTYIPVADGLQAELIRDGVVEIENSHLVMRDRLALRVIFAKVFVSRPEIPLIAEQWRDDPRANGLAVSQLEIRDGWLAVALSEEGSQFALEVAERARQVKLH